MRIGMSRITVRRAIQNLVSCGLVEIHRGKGTFIVAPKIAQELTELTGFVEDMYALGRKPTARVTGKGILTRCGRISVRHSSNGKKRILAMDRVSTLPVPGRLYFGNHRSEHLHGFPLK